MQLPFRRTTVASLGRLEHERLGPNISTTRSHSPHKISKTVCISSNDLRLTRESSTTKYRNVGRFNGSYFQTNEYITKRPNVTAHPNPTTRGRSRSQYASGRFLSQPRSAVHHLHQPPANADLRQPDLLRREAARALCFFHMC